MRCSALVLSALLVCIASNGLAEDASVRGRTRTFVMLGSRPYVESAPLELTLQDHTVFPVIQDVFLDANTGVDGLTVYVDAWLGIDAGERYLEERGVGDVVEGAIQWKSRHLTLGAGRLFQYSGFGRAQRFDGARIIAHPDLDIDFAPRVELFAGLPVYPHAGEEALLRSNVREVDTPIEVALGFAEWDRPGDLLFGAAVGGSYLEFVDARVGYVRENDLTEVSREALSFQIASRPLNALELSAHASYDLFAEAFEEGEVRLGMWGGRDLLISGYARALEPALLLPSTSILSVFGGAGHQDFGASVDWFVSRTRLSVGGELRRTDDPDGDSAGDLGHRIFASFRMPLPAEIGGRAILAFDRLDDGLGGYNYIRAGSEVPLVDILSMSLDAGAYVINDNDPMAVAPRDIVALRGSLGAILSWADTWRAVLAARATDTPELSNELAVIGRLEWNAVHTF